MRNNQCVICEAPFTDENPAVRPSYPQQRKSPRHAWKPARGVDVVVCEGCANTDRAGADSTTGLWSLLMRQFTLEEDWALEHCEVCAVPVKLRRGTRRKFATCSNSCRQKIYAGAEEQNERPCAHCGELMTGRADRRYCSSRCRVAAHREVPEIGSKPSERPPRFSMDRVLSNLVAEMRAVESSAGYMDFSEISPERAEMYFSESSKGFKVLRAIMRRLEQRAAEEG
ncbi:hypothetical protein MTQ12_00180 [Brevibacterium sp. R8603A2]|uniref:hypothetical protein n=1 Tax=Brevibacterium sp. R8603A2 TaxID=2929779 RepID=UPI001FFA4DAF|nr:hypothetical protein [Brevibacterium sp. R8603A2]MCK1801477.1 hypothetical protein [Brevibacterium sp. R8603A2]